MENYVPLHIHTEFSLLDGALKIKDYLNFAKEQGWPAAAITDHGNLFGAVKFFQEAKNYGLKPILGCEMYGIEDVFAPPGSYKYFHMTILVQNKEGYKNLCRIMEFAHSKGFYFKPRIDYPRLKEFSKGLIIGSGCLGGHISKLFETGQLEKVDKQIEWYLDVFGPQRFFLEVMPSEASEEQVKLNTFLLEKGKQFGVKVVATSDSHYLKKEHKNAHEVLLSIGTKDLLSNPERYSFGQFQAHLKSTKEMLEAFHENPEVVYNSGEIAKTCDFKFEFGKLMFPTFVTPEKVSADEFFAKQCRTGLQELFDKGLIDQNLSETYQKRLEIEIELITKMGFVGYFLVVGDFIAWAKKNAIPVGPGRGSAAGALVAWALQITNIDPIKYNLLFERFLNPERVSMPDIDIDFCINGRERVIQYVKDKYGHDSVCQIITFGTLMAKGVIKDVARVMGLNFKDSSSITDLIPDQIKITLLEALKNEPKLASLVKANSQVSQIFGIAQILEGITRHASKHAAGVVISPEPLKDVLPLFIPEKTNELVTQYAMGELEALGYLKMDFLGLKNLTVIDLTVASIARRTGTTIDMDKIPVDDSKVFAMLSDGRTCGVFQFEGEGVTQVIKRLKPDKFEDLIAVNALYRPGPLGSGMVDDFIDGRHGVKVPTYVFPELEPILSETYGVIVYQEQVMKISSAIAGYSLGGADILRRAMGKKKADVMEQQRSLFVQGAIKNGKDEVKAGKLFDLMAFFAGYGFNKSHSAAYALIAYQTAYLKAHYPADFEAAILSSETGDPDKLREYLEKTSQAGISVLPPDINRSVAEFLPLDSKTVLFGLKGIKNIGQAALEEVLKVRTQSGPFVDIYDFCTKVNQRVVNKRVIESLIKSGATDCFDGTRAQKLAEIEEIMNLTSSEKEFSAKGQRGLFANPLNSSKATANTRYKFKTNLDFTLAEKLAFEKEIVGFYLSCHPLDDYKNLESWLAIKPFFTQDPETLVKSPTLAKDEQIQFLAVLEAVRQIKTKAGQTMAVATFLTRESTISAVIFPTKFSSLEPHLSIDSVFVVHGLVDEISSNEIKIRLESLFNVQNFFASDFDKKQIVFSLGQEFSDSVKLLKAVETQSKDAFKIIACYQENGKQLRICPKNRFTLDQKLLADLFAIGVDIKITILYIKPDFKNFQYRQK